MALNIIMLVLLGVIIILLFILILKKDNNDDFKQLEIRIIKELSQNKISAMQIEILMKILLI